MQKNKFREALDHWDRSTTPTPLELNDGTTMMIPPPPETWMLDDDRLEDYEDLLMELETYDREPDLPDRMVDGEFLPAEEGGLKIPFQRNGERVTPPHKIRVVQTALGAEAYARLRAGGRSAADVQKIWGEQLLAYLSAVSKAEEALDVD